MKSTGQQLLSFDDVSGFLEWPKAAVLKTAVQRGPAVSEEAKKVRARKMIREVRSLGYRIELLPAPSSSPA